MSAVILLGFFLVFVIYNIMQGVIKDTPVIHDKEHLLNQFTGKSKM